MPILDNRIDAMEPVERSMKDSYNTIKNLDIIKNASPEHLPGILYALLTLGNQSWFTALFLLNADVTPLLNILITKWSRLLNKVQLLKVFTRAIVQKGSNECWFNLLRQISTDTTIPVMSIIMDKHAWFKALDLKLQAITIFSFLRNKQHLDFIVSFFAAKVYEVAICIGRDLILLLQSVSTMNPFLEKLCMDLIDNPALIDSRLTTIDALIAIPITPDFLKSRLNHDMERKLLFILQECKAAPKDHIRHISWFIRDHLENTPALYVDVIRFITNAYHPSNSQLASSVVPRCLILFHLLKAISDPAIAIAVKLVLVYDWIFFKPGDNIMNLEPVLLLMYRMPQSFITASILDYMRICAKEYIPKLNQRGNPDIAMKSMISSGVIRDLDVFNSAGEAVKSMLVELFPSSFHVGIPEIAIIAPLVWGLESPSEIEESVLQYTRVTPVQQSEFELLLIPRLHDQKYTMEFIDIISKLYIADKEKVVRKALELLFSSIYKLNINIQFSVLEYAIAKDAPRTAIKWSKHMLALFKCEQDALVYDYLSRLHAQDLDVFYTNVVQCCRLFKAVCVANPRILQLVFSMCDPVSIFAMCMQFDVAEFELFGTDVDLVIVNIQTTFSWPSFDQQSVWHALSMEVAGNADFLESFLPGMMGVISADSNVEAMTGIGLLMMQMTPSVRAFGAILGAQEYSLPFSALIARLLKAWRKSVDIAYIVCAINELRLGLAKVVGREMFDEQADSKGLANRTLQCGMRFIANLAVFYSRSGDAAAIGVALDALCKQNPDFIPLLVRFIS